MLAHFGNFSLDAGHPSATRAIIVVHGTNRNADDYFEYVTQAAAQEGVAGSTIIVAPQFQASASASGELYWPEGDWREGGEGRRSGGASVSSYAVLDALVRRLNSTLFPALTDVVVTGHSAGGQVAQRYAAGSNVNPSPLAVRYVPANPSSYLYFNGSRWVDGSFKTSGPTFSACPSYDDYKYGLKSRGDVPFMANQSDETLIAKYKGRRVVYLLGEQDTCNSDLASCDDSDLEKSCPAMMQGDYRLQRGERYFAHLDAHFPGHGHVLQKVPGVGHSGKSMFNSVGGRQTLFH